MKWTRERLETWARRHRLDFSDLRVCARCGSPEVQVLDWVLENTNELVGGMLSDSSEDSFCPECDEGHGTTNVMFWFRDGPA